jgi:hypothetical protein
LLHGTWLLLLLLLPMLHLGWLLVHLQQQLLHSLGDRQCQPLNLLLLITMMLRQNVSGCLIGI